MKTHYKLAATLVVAAVGSVLAAAIAPDTALFHERKEVAGLAKVHTVDFNFTINDRSTLELPRRRGGGR